MSVSSTNPGTTFGVGTWTAWGAGRVPVGVDTGDTSFDTVEETGGAKTHTLTTAEMPEHKHDILAKVVDAVGVGVISTVTQSGTTDLTLESSMSLTGGDEAHNNLQPYITCYMWKRTE